MARVEERWASGVRGFLAEAPGKRRVAVPAASSPGGGDRLSGAVQTKPGASGWRVLRLAAAGALIQACGTNNTYYIEQHIHTESDDAGASPTAPAPSSPDPEPVPRPFEGEAEGVIPLADELDAGVSRLDPGAPAADVTASALVVDVFGAIGNHYWFDVSDEQLELMNAPYLGGLGGGFFAQDIYTPQGKPDVTFVDHLFVTSAGDAAHTADFGKVQVRLVGQSTGRAWTDNTLPNFKLDADEFTDGNRIGGVKHMRLNNAVVGSIFREKLAFDLYRALGYPAPRSSYAWVSGSVWGPGIAVPYIAVESYKPQFCSLREAELGGGCVNMWEFYGDIGSGILGYPDNCQFSECEPSRGLEFEQVVASTEPGEGYKAALTDWLDWDAFHRFQCLSWILETGDDALHNQNNVVIVERADGKFQFLPYSVDISLGQEWYSAVSLGGSNTLALGCQSDPECWADTIATCEVMIDAFVAAAPVALLDAQHAQLEQAGMLRSGDEARYKTLRRHIESRLVDLPVELEENREAPVIDNCFPYIQCGDQCVVLPEECVLCDAPAAAESPPGAAIPDGGVLADAGAEPPPSGGDDQCLQPIDVYLRPIPF